MKKLIIFGLSFCFYLKPFAQAEARSVLQEMIKLPIAATPNAAALGKFGDIQVGLSTGIPSIKIPFYEYKSEEKKMIFSIGLAYHAGGNKVEDMSSNCGLGWALSAGGVVTRSVNGIPDEKQGGYLNSDALPYYNTQPGAYFNYLSTSSIGTHIAITKKEDINGWFLIRDIQNRTKDGEADIFSFTVGDIAGKFIIRKNLQVQLLTLANVSISVDFVQNNSNSNNINSITIINKNNGVKYFFDVKEVTNPSAINLQTQYGSEPYSNIVPYISNWYLSKIVSADQTDTIKLFYSNPVELIYEAGFSESITCELAGPLSSNEISNPSGSYSYTQMLNNSVHINEILFPDNTKVKFNYNFPRLDLHRDSALTSIEIENNNVRKLFNLGYDYFISPPCTISDGNCATFGSLNDYTKRLKLTYVQQSDGLDTLPAHRFEYNSTPLPTRKSKSQDYWGYHNGAHNFSYIPQSKLIEFPNTYAYLGTAYREAVEEFAKACVLEKIYYPTGGYSKFTYESNRAFGDDYKIDQRVDTLGLTQSSYNQNVALPFISRTENNVKFTIKLNVDTSSNGGPQNAWGCNFSYIITSTDNTFSHTITATIEEFLNGYNATISMPIDKSYNIKYTSVCPYLPPTYDMKIYTEYTIVPKDRLIGGIRVVKSEDYDVLNSQVSISNYNYSNNEGHSTGDYQNLPNYHYYRSTLQQWITDPTTGFLLYALPRYFVHRSSTPTQSLSYYSGSPVIYKKVKVDKTVNNVSNGYSVHTFSSFPSSQLVSGDYPYIQKQDLEWRQGLSLSDSIFTSADNLKVVNINEYDFYETLENNSNCRNLITNLVQNDDKNTELNIVYGARGYYYRTGRASLRRTISKSYEGNNVKEIEQNYFYSPSNFLVTKQNSRISNGDLLETRLYYANNYNSSVLPSNVNIHNGEDEIISKEEWVLKGASWHLRSATVKDFQPYDMIVRNSKIIHTELKGAIPETIVGVFDPSQLKRNASFKDQVQIAKYNSNGKINEVNTVNKPTASLLWSPINKSLIATVTNATLDNIAYTTFEKQTYGNWLGINDGNILTQEGITGDSYYQQSSFNIYKTGLDVNKVYKVTYWTKNNTSYAINGNQLGWPKLIKTSVIGSETWSLYEHYVTGQNTISISGSGSLDELRLYPVDAEMSTTTFNPLTGTTSTCDVNNIVAYYEYDTFNRLKAIRDQDHNIIKTFEYKYQQPQ